MAVLKKAYWKKSEACGVKRRIGRLLDNVIDTYVQTSDI